jgi:hypothetical protein
MLQAGTSKKKNFCGAKKLQGACSVGQNSTKGVNQKKAAEPSIYIKYIGRGGGGWGVPGVPLYKFYTVRRAKSSSGLDSA